MVDAFMKETDEFKQFSVMKRFQNIHLRGIKSVRKDANNLVKVFEQMSYSKLFNYKEKLEFILSKKFNHFDVFFDFFINSRNDKNNWLKTCLRYSICKTMGFINRKMYPKDLYIVEDSVRVNSREISTSSIIEKMKHDLFKNGSYNIVKGKLTLYENKALGIKHHFPNEINWKEKTSFELVDGDFYYKNLRLNYRGRAERKGNPSVKTMVNRLEREGKPVSSGRVNIIVRHLPGKRSVGEKMLLTEEYDPEKDTIDTLYYIKKFIPFVKSSMNLEENEAKNFLFECYNEIIGTSIKKRELSEDDKESQINSLPGPNKQLNQKKKKKLNTDNETTVQSKITDFLNSN